MKTSPHALLRSAFAAFAVGASTLLVSAQSSAPAASAIDKPAPDAGEPAELEVVEVTGSRIRTLVGEQTAIPVYTITQVELERRGVSRLADIRWAIPQLGGTIGFNDNLLNGGPSRAQTVGTSFNMRGLGGNSTLVLVDGRRIPHTGQEAPGGAGGREDFSVDGIPISAIERIDILPQGAGAIYGAEAIAGVINIVLKKNYSGATLTVAHDNTFDSDVGQTTVSLTAGYRSGKLSTFVSASFENQNGLSSRDRWFTATADLRRFGSTSTNFLFSNTAGAGSLSSGFSPANGGATLVGSTSNVVLIPSGSNGSSTANAAYTPVATANVPLYDSAAYSTQIDPAKRESFLVRADYQLTRTVQLYGSLRWSQFENNFTGTPITLATRLPVGAPGNPFPGDVTPALTSGANPVEGPVLSKVFYDLPLPRIDSFQRNVGASLGASGNFFDTWRYDVSASWGRNVAEDDQLTASGFNFSLLSAALASSTPPILAYDSSTTRDPNAAGVLAALMPFADHKDTTDTYQYLVSADGSVWTGWAGDVRAAVGAEYGEEKVKFWREPSLATPTFVLTKPFSRELTAVFAEVTVPLLSGKQHLPLVHLLEIGGAARATDYSDVGAVTTPSVRALFQPVKWLTLRASRSEGFKPVRLYDLQAPVTTFTQTITTTTTIRDPQRGNLQVPAGTYTYRSGGNPTLKPEESVSRNAGIVLDVPGKLFKGLSFSADYYEIDYTDRSGSTGLQILLNYFPERVTRAALTTADAAAGYTGGVVQTWDASNINLAGVFTKGWDYRMTYQRAFGFGELTARVAYTNPDVIFTQATPAAAPSSTFGYQPERVSGSLFLTRGPWDVGLSINYQARYFINGLTAASYPENLEFNPQVSYDFAKNPAFGADAKSWAARAFSGGKFSVTIINALDRDPSFFDAANGRNVMDPRLRRYIVSFSKQL